MRFKIEHETRYRYSQPVFFEPHLVRLNPRCDASQKLIAFSLRVFPQPAGICEIADPSGNPVIRLWFEGLHDELLLHTRLTAATLRVNPFDYLLEPAACKELNKPWT